MVELIGSKDVKFHTNSWKFTNLKWFKMHINYQNLFWKIDSYPPSKVMASISTMCIHHWPLIQLSWSNSYFRWHFCHVQFHIIRSHLSIGICCILSPENAYDGITSIYWNSFCWFHPLHLPSIHIIFIHQPKISWNKVEETMMLKEPAC